MNIYLNEHDCAISEYGQLVVFIYTHCRVIIWLCQTIPRVNFLESSDMILIHVYLLVSCACLLCIYIDHCIFADVDIITLVINA